MCIHQSEVTGYFRGYAFIGMLWDVPQSQSVRYDIILGAEPGISSCPGSLDKTKQQDFSIEFWLIAWNKFTMCRCLSRIILIENTWLHDFNIPTTKRLTTLYYWKTCYHLPEPKRDVFIEAVFVLPTVSVSDFEGVGCSANRGHTVRPSVETK